MIRNIIHDPMLLARVSAPSDDQDGQLIQDLKDTLNHNREACVGMAANMIGEYKCVIALIEPNGNILVMRNPKIMSTKQPYQAVEGCLSLAGERETTRYEQIKVSWQDEQGKPKIKTFKGFTAQIIQHEIDHCNGILI